MQPLPLLGPAFFTVPAALVTFRAAGGALRLLPTGWVGLVCSRPQVVIVAVDRPPAGEEWSGEFAVHLPPEEMLASPAFRALAAAGGSELGGGEEAAERLLAGCPVRLECRHGVVRFCSGLCLLSGEVAAVHPPPTDSGAESRPEGLLGSAAVGSGCPPCR